MTKILQHSDFKVSLYGGKKGARFDFHLLLQPVNQLFAIEHCYSTIIYMLLLMVDIQCIAGMNIYRNIP